MGKARILSGGSDGLYTIERVYDRTFYEQEKADLEAEVANLDARLQQANEQLDAIEAQATEADQALKEAQELYVEAVRNRNENPDAEWVDSETGEAIEDVPAFYMAQLERIMESVAEVYTARSGLKHDIELMKASKLAAEKRIQQMDAVADPPPESAWCADFIEHAWGEVATIEIPGEPQKLLVAPQHEDGAGEPVGGTLMPREWMTGPQAFFNAAILPGWQRWKPTYRVGVIQGLDLDSDTCTVRIEGAFSTAQDLYVNSLDHVTLADVPIQYMGCNALAFDAGDRVAVLFSNSDWSDATVVGFESAPRQCPASSHYEVGFYLVANAYWDEATFERVSPDKMSFDCELEDGSLGSYLAHHTSGRAQYGRQEVVARVERTEVNEWKDGGYNYGDDEYEWSGVDVGTEYETPWKGPRYGEGPDPNVVSTDVSTPEPSGIRSYTGSTVHDSSWAGSWVIKGAHYSRAFGMSSVEAHTYGAAAFPCEDGPGYMTACARMADGSQGEPEDLVVIDDPDEAKGLLLSWGLPASLTATHKETGRTFNVPIARARWSWWNYHGGMFWVTYSVGDDPR